MFAGGLGSRLCRDFCRIGIISIPIIHYALLVGSQHGDPGWICLVVLVGMLVELVLPFVLLYVTVSVRRSNGWELAIDLDSILLGLAAEVFMIFLLVVYMTVHAKC